MILPNSAVGSASVAALVSVLSSPASSGIGVVTPALFSPAARMKSKVSASPHVLPLNTFVALSSASVSTTSFVFVIVTVPSLLVSTILASLNSASFSTYLYVTVVFNLFEAASFATSTNA